MQKHVDKSPHAIYGFLAGSLAGLLLQPLEIIKMGMIIGPSNNEELKKTIRKKNFIQ